MGVVLRLPVRRAVPVQARVARIFEPQLEMDAAMRTAQRFLAASVGVTALLLVGLQLWTH